MEDLISRQRAIKAMDTWDKFGCDQNGMLVRYDDDKHYVPYVHYDDMVHVIKSLPSAEPKKGRWVFTRYYVWECSECGENPTKGMGYIQRRSELFRYCPHCGAKMSEIPTDLESEDKE